MSEQDNAEAQDEAAKPGQQGGRTEAHIAQAKISPVGPGAAMEAATPAAAQPPEGTDDGRPSADAKPSGRASAAGNEDMPPDRGHGTPGGSLGAYNETDEHRGDAQESEKGAPL